MSLFSTGIWDVISQLGIGGAIACVILVIVFYFQNKKPPNGNGHYAEDKAREMGKILTDIEYLRVSVDGLTRGMGENQARVSELAGNVQALTRLVSRNFK